MKFCTRCGMQLDDTAIFCSRCGLRQPPLQAGIRHPQPQPPAGPWNAGAGGWQGYHVGQPSGRPPYGQPGMDAPWGVHYTGPAAGGFAGGAVSNAGSPAGAPASDTAPTDGPGTSNSNAVVPSADDATSGPSSGEGLYANLSHDVSAPDTSLSAPETAGPTKPDGWPSAGAPETETPAVPQPPREPLPERPHWGKPLDFSSVGGTSPASQPGMAPEPQDVYRATPSGPVPAVGQPGFVPGFPPNSPVPGLAQPGYPQPGFTQPAPLPHKKMAKSTFYFIWSMVLIFVCNPIGTPLSILSAIWATSASADRKQSPERAGERLQLCKTICIAVTCLDAITIVAGLVIGILYLLRSGSFGAVTGVPSSF